jgi:type IV pilus assembly protein PilY1
LASPSSGALLSRRVLLGLLLLTALPASATDVVTFSQGSLIIPEQATFQQGCGSLSAYGLVWRLLQSNEAGGFNANHPVTVYLAIDDTKRSPNRCVPTNRHRPPAPNNGQWDDPSWNDGCDFHVSRADAAPVVMVPPGQALPSGGLFPEADIDNFATTTTEARPNFARATLNTAGGFRDVQYMGGAFIIDARDAKNALDFLNSSGGPDAPNKFRTPCNCDTFTNNSGCFYVRMHQATIEFNAPIGRRLNRVPPKIALLDRHDNNAGDASYVKGGMLDDYLRNAGLDFPGAGGCPQGTNTTCTLNGGRPGLIYDALHANADLISTNSFPHGLLNAVDPSTQRPRYRVFWAPHWEIGDSSRSAYQSNGDGAANQKENVLNNIAYFTNQRGNGLFAECASIWSYETTTRPNGTLVQSSRFQGDSAFQRNQLTGGASWDGRNCTDPDYRTESSPRPACVLYPNPGDPFSQMGDFRFNNVAGHTENYRTTYKNGVRRLAVSWRNHAPGDRYDDAADVAANAQRGHDFFSFNQKDNDPQKATVVYLAGHDFKGSVAGTRIVLNTLLNLGSEPLQSERTVSAPVALDDTNGSDSNGSRALLFKTSYNAVTGYPPGADTYTPSQGSHWVFPYYPGTLRAHSLIGGNALTQGENSLSDGTLWDADARMPAPGARNLFTYFGGEVTVNPPLGVDRAAPHGVLQVGWVPEEVSGTRINRNYSAAPNPNCVDVMKLGRVLSRDGNPRYDFVKGGDGICDLQQATQYSPQLGGSDFGVTNELLNKTQLSNDFNAVAMMLQRVRGYCYATVSGRDGANETPILQPTPTQCNSDSADNKAHLGGFIHSSPVVVPASTHIPDRNAPRPTVAYAAGLDGQLHAFYVSGGARYDGPVGPPGFPNPDASARFKTDYAQRFRSGATPPPGTELWSFLPATQLVGLRNNTARVNSAPAVFDVFADFVGTGRREWHTVLVANVGQTGRDLFALDVTNPLKPVLLWHLVGSHYATASAPHSAVSLSDRDTGGTDWTYTWNESTSVFVLPPRADPGRHASGLYDYSGLGGSRGLSVGVGRLGMEPVYAVFVAASSSGAPVAGNSPGSPAKGVQVFAIDVATGQKLWQWQQPYTTAVDNSAPAAPTVSQDSSGAARLYVGDMEGRLWELDASTGMNINVARMGPACSEAAPCKYAAMNIGALPPTSQPISTNVGLARIPRDAANASAFGQYKGRLVALVGTAGMDWVPDSVAGRFHALLLDADLRLPLGVDGKRLDGVNISAGQAHMEETQYGVLQEPSPFPLIFDAPEHVYGNITVAGRTAYFSTAEEAINDPMLLSGSVRGRTYSIDLGNTATTQQSITPMSGATLANYGGVAVYHRDTGGASQDYVVGAEVSALRVTRIDNATNTGASSPNAKDSVDGDNGVLYQLLNWSQRFFE